MENPYAPPATESDLLIQESPSSFPLSTTQILKGGLLCSLVSGLFIFSVEWWAMLDPWTTPKSSLPIRSAAFGSSGLVALLYFGFWVPYRFGRIRNGAFVCLGLIAPIALFGYFVLMTWLRSETFVGLLAAVGSFAAMLAAILWLNRYPVNVRAALATFLAPLLWFALVMVGVFAFVVPTPPTYQDCVGYPIVNVTWTWSVTAQLAFGVSLPRGQGVETEIEEIKSLPVAADGDGSSWRF